MNFAIPWFKACDLSIEIERLVHQSVVFGILLYSAKTWAPTQLLVKKLETFHRSCIKCIMGIGCIVQWAEHISTAQLAEHFGMQESVSFLLCLSGLKWL